MALYDLIGFGVWLLLLPMIKRVTTERFGLETGDIVFASLTILVVIELVWLRVGYPAP
jgi:predicted small integral membrane protein